MQLGGERVNKNAYLISLITLAIPAIIENSLQSLVGFVDTLFISKLGINEVASVGIANNIIQIYFAVFMAISTASTIYISRYTGAKEPEKVKHTITHSLILTIIVGLLFGLVSWLFAENLLKLLGASNEVLSQGVLYFRIVTTPSLLISLMYTLGAILRGTGDTKSPMRVGIIMNVMHIVLDYVLIFGVFFDGFGIAGAGAATVVARLIGVILLFRSLISKQLITKVFSYWKMNISVFKGLLNLGLPTGFERLFMRVGQVIYFGMILRMGTEVYAAHTITGNLTIFATIVGTGLGVATTTLIGKSLGANDSDSAKKYAKVSIIITSVSMSIISLIMFATSPWIAPIFTTNATVTSLIIIALGIDTLVQPAIGTVSAYTSILQAGGDTKFPMYSTAIGIWAIRTVGVYVFGIHFGLGIVGVRIAIAIDNYLRAGFLYYRYRSNKWIKKLT